MYQDCVNIDGICIIVKFLFLLVFIAKLLSKYSNENCLILGFLQIVKKYKIA